MAKSNKDEKVSKASASKPTSKKAAPTPPPPSVPAKTAAPVKPLAPPIKAAAPIKSTIPTSSAASDKTSVAPTKPVVKSKPPVPAPKPVVSSKPPVPAPKPVVSSKPPVPAPKPPVQAPATIQPPAPVAKSTKKPIISAIPSSPIVKPAVAPPPPPVEVKVSSSAVEKKSKSTSTSKKAVVEKEEKKTAKTTKTAKSAATPKVKTAGTAAAKAKTTRTTGKAAAKAAAPSPVPAAPSVAPPRPSIAELKPSAAAAEVAAPSPIQAVPPSAPKPAPSIFGFERDLPAEYGDTRIVALIRDPEWIYLYWEVGADSRKRFDIPRGMHSKPMALRVYDVTDVHFDGSNAHSFFDQPVSDMASSWYLRIPEPNRSYVADLGLYDPEGNFMILARSNVVSVPPSGMTWITEEQWMNVTDAQFAEIFRMSGGLRLHERTGSGGVPVHQEEEILSELRRQWVGSGMWSGASGAISRPEKRKGFWLEVWCDVVVYGATEPTAKVTLQGREIQLSPDGRFHARFSLPDGQFEFPVRAVNETGDDTREITPIVIRKTK